MLEESSSFKILTFLKYLQGFLFQVVLLKKLTVLLIVFTMLLGGAWLTLRFAPEWIPALPSLQSKTLEPQGLPVATTSPAEYLTWRDSVDAIDLLIRSEQDPRILRSLKERQQYFWKKLQSARQSIPPPLPEPLPAVAAVAESTPTTIAIADEGLVKFLSKVLTITAAVLVLLIGILLLLLKRRKDVLTRHLEAIREDDRFQGARSGVLDSEPQRHATRLPKNARTSSPNAVPDTKNLDLGELAATLTGRTIPPQAPRDGSPLRPTAKQRVTTALKGLAEALSALKEDGTSSASPSGKQDESRTESEKSRVRSPNILRPTVANQVFATTRFEREQEENTEILKLARRGFTSSEIARRLRIPQDQVETVVRMHRDGE